MTDFLNSRLSHLAPPAAVRNTPAICSALKDLLPNSGLILEIASGSGYHAAILAHNYPYLIWQPSELNESGKNKLINMNNQANLSNLREPIIVDAENADWSVNGISAVLCINMVHITRWSVTCGLFKGVSNLPKRKNLLFLYGPFKINGKHTSDSNFLFDQSLRDQNSDWGVRDIVELDILAEENNLKLGKRISMPVNNMILVYVSK